MNPLSNPIQNQQVFIFTANAKTYMKVSKLSVVCACVCVCVRRWSTVCCDVLWQCCDGGVKLQRRDAHTGNGNTVFFMWHRGAAIYSDNDNAKRQRQAGETGHTHTYTGFMCLVSTSGLCIYSNPSAQTSTIMKGYTFILILTRELIWP